MGGGWGVVNVYRSFSPSGLAVLICQVPNGTALPNTENRDLITDTDVYLHEYCTKQVSIN